VKGSLYKASASFASAVQQVDWSCFWQMSVSRYWKKTDVCYCEDARYRRRV